MRDGHRRRRRGGGGLVLPVHSGRHRLSFSTVKVWWLLLSSRSSVAVGWRWGRNSEPSRNSTEKGKQILWKKQKSYFILSLSFSFCHLLPVLFSLSTTTSIKVKSV